METSTTAAGVQLTPGQDCYTLAIPAAQFAAAIRATATAADTSAYSLAGFDCISFTAFSDGGWEVAATDRYRLAVAGTVDKGERVSNAILPAKPLATFAKGVKPPKRGSNGEPVRVSLTTDLVSFAWDGVSVSWKREELHDTFPSYWKILETTYSDVAGSSLWNPVFIADGMDACRMMGDKDSPVRWDCPNPSKSVTLSPDRCIDGMSFVYVCMAMRGN